MCGRYSATVMVDWTFDFKQEEWFVLDQMVKKVNRRTGFLFLDFESWLRWRIAEELKMTGTNFWGNQDEKMIELGEKIWKGEG